MGGELGEIFYLLWQELALLNLQWKQFVSLFGSGERRIKVLSDSAPEFFVIVRNLLWSEAILGIARLLAPPKSYGKQNLTMRRLPPLISQRELSKRVSDGLDQAEERASPVKDWRNRRIAHRDLLVALKRPPEPLAAVTRESIEGCLRLMGDVMNAIELAYLNATTTYSHIISSHDAEDLLYCLRDGIHFHRISRELSGMGPKVRKLALEELERL